MNLLGLFISSFLLSCVHSVHIEDAFVKDWIKRFHSPFIKYDMVNKNMIGLTSDNMLILSDPIVENNLLWSIDLNNIPGVVNDYILTPDLEYIYLYSNTSNQLFAFETRTGLYIDSYSFSSHIIQVENAFSNNLLVLDASGKLYHFSNGLNAVLSINDTIKNFQFTQRDGSAYILYNGKMLAKVDLNLNIIDSTSFLESEITQFQNGIIVTKDKICKILNSEHLSINCIADINDTDHIKVIDKEYFVSYKDSELSIFSIELDEMKLLKKDTFNKEIMSLKVLKKSLNTIVIVSYISTSGRSYDAILNLTDFLQDHNNGITTFRISGLNLKYFLTYTDELHVMGVSQSPEEIIVSSLNMVSGVHNTSKIDNISTGSTHYLIIDKPISENTIFQVHHLLDKTGGSFLSSWLTRIYRHLSNLGEYVTSLIVDIESRVNTFIEEDTFGLEKLIIFVDEPRNRLVALNSIDGSLVWKSTEFENSSEIVSMLEFNDTISIIFTNEIQLFKSLNGEKVDSKYFNSTICTVIKAKNNLCLDTLLLKLSTGEYLTFNSDLIDEDQYFIESNENEVNGFQLNENGKTNTWKFSKKGEEILKVSSKSIDSKTQSVGIALSNKSILYKYLYPNVVTVFTRCDKNFKLYLIDGVTGILLQKFEHSSLEFINFESIKVIMDDNWIVYSYLVQSPRVEQRINIIDLFDTSKAIGDGEVSSLNYNLTVDSVESKSYIFPQKILSLASTRTSFGITLKSIIVATENGELYEIPKSVLSGRRIDDRELSQEDFQNDFKVIPYEPIIGLYTYKILNHKQRLMTDEYGKILIKPTNLESTLLVCYINKDNIFSTYVLPSLSYDSLGHKFDKTKLVITILGIFICYLILTPFVSRKKLNSKWIDNP